MSSIQYMEEYFRSDINKENLKSFLLSFKDGNIELIKWLLYYDYNLNLSMCDDLPLCIAVEHNQLQILRMMFKFSKDINLNKHYEHIIIVSIEEGFIDVLKWIYNIDSSLIFRMDMTDMFRLSIRLNYLDITRWIFEICKNNNIKIKYFSDNDDIFIQACQSDNIKLVELLVDVRPKGYYVNIFDNKIIAFEIVSSLVIDNKLKSESDSEICKICYENISNVITSCNHLFCFECLERHYCINNENCPFCRKRNEEDDLILLV